MRVLRFGEEEREGGTSSGQPGLDGSHGDARLGGDLLDGQVGDVVQDDRETLRLRDLAQGGDDGDAVAVDLGYVGRPWEQPAADLQPPEA